MTDSEAEESSRVALAGDRHRPFYHFLAPSNWMNDPNGACFWNGKYHLFYQYNPNGAFWGTIHWGHAASSDLVHWQDFPVALTPSKNGPDKEGCWSGCVVNDNGIATAFYTGAEPQTVCVATSDDSELRTWQQHESPVIDGPPPNLDLTGSPSITGHSSADFRDPYVWREGDRWLLVIGAGMREKGGTALLYESEDLRHWRYRGPILTDAIGAHCNMWECPVLLRFGDRFILFVCPHPEAKYIYWISGTWEEGAVAQATQLRGKLDLGPYAYAAQCLRDPARDRYLLWTWIKEGRTAEAQRAAGWSGLLSLPKECSIDPSGKLVVKPAAELALLRKEGRCIEGLRLTPASEDPLSGCAGDCLEIELELAFDGPTICELIVRASPDQAERTTIAYDSAERTLTVDGSRSSLDSSVDHETISGPLDPDHQGVIRLRLFLDRSVLEVIAAERVCITQRLYPTRKDGLGSGFTVKKGSTIIHRLAVWQLASIWPDKASKMR
jgi:beta-fructofuranosidase